MSHSVRISDELHARLRISAGPMGRSIAQQLEFLAKLGLAVETSPHVSAQQLRLIAEAAYAPSPNAVEISEERYEAAFRELANMQGNPALEARLEAAGAPVVYRDENGHLAERAPGSRKARQAR